MTNSQPSSAHWYDKKWLVILLVFVFFPVGAYGLWKSSMSIIAKVLLTFVGLLILIGFFTGSDKGMKTETVGTTTEVVPEKYFKIGDQVSVGNFVYWVNNIKYTKTIKNNVQDKTADGIYLVVELQLMNRDKESHTIDNNLFKLFDAKGIAYSHSTEGDLALQYAGLETLFLKQVNPNIQKVGYVCFEVPEKGTYNLKLSGGYWSGATEMVRLVP